MVMPAGLEAGKKTEQERKVMERAQATSITVSRMVMGLTRHKMGSTRVRGLGVNLELTLLIM